MLIRILLSVVTGYLLGSLNSSILTGRLYKTDIKSQGSGNAGLTNTLRVLGKKAALIVLIGDILKGIVSYILGYLISGNTTGAMFAGTAAIIGHIWPLYFGFKGGKGVLTSLAVLFMMDWVAALILLCIFGLIVLVTRYVSLGSIVAAICFPILSLILSRDVSHVIFSIAIAALLIFMHKSNILRLIAGNESKIGSGGKK